MVKMTRDFPRKIESLRDIFTFISEFAQKGNLDGKKIFLMNLVLEELFTNAVKYIKGNKNPVTIDLSKSDDKLVISLMDKDVDSFDIRMKEKYDFKKKLEERKVGGLGIPLINKMVDKVDYNYENRNSTITLIKYLENEHVRNINKGQ